MEHGGEAVVVSPDSSKPEDLETKFLRLGFLRPKDTFRFAREVPFYGITLDQEYRVIPAQRGVIKFTDDRSAVYTVPLSYACGIRVVADGITRKYQIFYFYPGDKVRSSDTGAKGIVQHSRGQGYLVQFEGVESSQWVPGDTLTLIEKEKTTLGYVSYDSEKDVFCVGFAHIQTEHDTAISALKWLREHNRPAFHRLSMFISRMTKGTAANVFQKLAWCDQDVLEFLWNADSKAWDSETISRVNETMDWFWKGEGEG